MNSDRLQTVSIARAAVLAQYGDVEDVQRKDMGRCSTIESRPFIGRRQLGERSSTVRGRQDQGGSTALILQPF
jgi:hypothetical protein